jgi:hypothetical protein
MLYQEKSGNPEFHSLSIGWLARKQSRIVRIPTFVCTHVPNLPIQLVWCFVYRCLKFEVFVQNMPLHKMKTTKLNNTYLFRDIAKHSDWKV